MRKIKIQQDNKSLYAGVAQILGINSATMTRYYKAFCEYIAKELYLKGICVLPHLGTFKTKTIPEGYVVDKRKKIQNGTYVPEHKKVYFTLNPEFLDAVNYKGVSSEYKKRLVLNELTEEDIRRLETAESLKEQYSLSERELITIRKRFIDYLNLKRKKWESEQLENGKELQ